MDRFAKFIAAIGIRDEGMTAENWFRRGLLRFVSYPIIKEDAEVATVWCHGFSEGARDALRLAGIILSDPAVRGREQEALKLLADGRDHASIIAALRVSRPAGDVGNVISISDRGSG